jgi:hypothetical protein
MSSIAPNADRTTIGYITVQKRQFSRAIGTAVNTLGFSVFDADQFKGENRDKLKGILDNLILVTIENKQFKEIHFTQRAYDYIKSKNLTHCSHRGTLVANKVLFVPDLTEDEYENLKTLVNASTNPYISSFKSFQMIPEGKAIKS